MPPPHWLDVAKRVGKWGFSGQPHSAPPPHFQVVLPGCSFAKTAAGVLCVALTLSAPDTS